MVREHTSHGHLLHALTLTPAQVPAELVHVQGSRMRSALPVEGVRGVGTLSILPPTGKLSVYIGVICRSCRSVGHAV